MRDDVAAVRAGLDAMGPLRVLAALGVPHQREGRGARLCCPMHQERTPSATLSIGPAGSLRLHCFGACSRSWDALALLAAVRGLDVKADFRAVLQEAADVAGVVLEDSAAGSGFSGSRTGIYRERPVNYDNVIVAPPSYPPDAFELWSQCAPVTADAEVRDYLAGRGLDAARVAHLDLARVIPTAEVPQLPRWAWARGESWASSGHRLVVPAYDAQGRLRSLRASRVQTRQDVANGSPKRLAPSGHTCAGLVFAEPKALALLSNPEGVAEDMIAAWGEVRVVVCEGEPDFLTSSLAWPDWPVIGVFSGAWTEAVSARIPDGAHVVIAVHQDNAGRRYADAISATLTGRCRVERAPIGTEDAIS